jgi:hypothetical protein
LKNKIRFFVFYYLHSMAEICERKRNIYGTDGNYT